MKITYDKQADAMYFTFNQKVVSKTIPVNEHVRIDVDGNGEMVGIELLEATTNKGMSLEADIKKGLILIEDSLNLPINA